MTTTAWAHLPNARHIDAVLADVKARPEVWKAVRDAACDAAGYAALGAARSAAWDAAWASTLGAVWDTVRSAAWSAAWDAAWSVAWWPVAALIAWDSAADLLDLSPDALRVLIDVAAPPVCHQAVLLLPWVIVRESQP